MINQSEFSLHLTNPKGKTVCVLPGGEIPAWAEKDITNPYVLGIDPDADTDDGDDEVDVAVPPQHGRGSGLDKWVAYAEAKGVDTDGLDRDGIIAACEEAGVPVE